MHYAIFFFFHITLCCSQTSHFKKGQCDFLYVSSELLLFIFLTVGFRILNFKLGQYDWLYMLKKDIKVRPEKEGIFM